MLTRNLSSSETEIQAGGQQRGSEEEGSLVCCQTRLPWAEGPVGAATHQACRRPACAEGAGRGPHGRPRPLSFWGDTASHSLTHMDLFRGKLFLTRHKNKAWDQFHVNVDTPI